MAHEETYLLHGSYTHSSRHMSVNTVQNANNSIRPQLEIDIKDGFSPLKTKLELWFIGTAMPIYPPHHPACQTLEGAQRRC